MPPKLGWTGIARFAVGTVSALGQLGRFLHEMDQAFTPLSEVEHVRRKLMEMKIGKNVSTYIQAFHTQMYKVSQDEPGRSFLVVHALLWGTTAAPQGPT